MKLTYGQLETTLAAQFRIHPDKLTTFRARMKQLQRLQFPPGVNVGRGARMEYSSEHLFMLLTAFELIGTGLPAQSACGIVVGHWQQFAAGYALAALQARKWEPSGDESSYALVHIRSLHDMQFEKFGTVRPSIVSIHDLGALTAEMRPYDWRISRSCIVIPLSAILAGTLKAATDIAGVQQANEYSRDFNAWLPKDDNRAIQFALPYPDRSNIAMRRRLNATYGNDPESGTPEGAEEARAFAENHFSDPPPF